MSDDSSQLLSAEEEALQHLTPGDRALVRRVCQLFDVLVTHVFSRRRPADVALARQACMAMIYGKGDGPGLKAVGQMFCGRDHGTVMHARDKIQQMMRAGDDRLAMIIEEGYKARNEANHENGTTEQ